MLIIQKEFDFEVEITEADRAYYKQFLLAFQETFNCPKIRKFVTDFVVNQFPEVLVFSPVGVVSVGEIKIPSFYEAKRLITKTMEAQHV